MNVFDDIKDSIVNLFDNTAKKYTKSKKWREYHLGITLNHCFECAKRNNKIYKKRNEPILPEHERCACYLDWLRSVRVGQATLLGVNGADYYFANYSALPDYYLTKEEAVRLGWKAWLGNLNTVAPGKMIGGNIFYNREGKLPNASGRIWYECDIDYDGGFRNNYRIIYSNDGLMFKTDSHYSEFIAVE